MSVKEKILVIRYGSLGDLILTTGPIQNLRKAYPDSEIYLTTKEQYKPIVDIIPGLKGYFLYPERINPLRFNNYIKDLKRVEFDRVIDLHNSLRSRIVRNSAGFRNVSVYDSQRVRRKSYLKMKDIKPPFRHTVEMYNDALDINDIKDLILKPVLKSKSNVVREKTNNVGIVTSAKNPTKKWLIEYFIETASRIAEEGFKPIIICDRDDLNILNNTRLGQIAETVVEPDLENLIDLIIRCRIVTCGDTGPMHLATALSVPAIAVFGPTHPCLGFSPLGKLDKVLTINMECSPCSLHGEKACYRERRYCMEDLKPDMVIKAFKALLDVL
jgi:heptosyltransferase-2